MRRHRPLRLALQPTSAPVTPRPCALTAPAPVQHAGAPVSRPLGAIPTPPIDAVGPSRVDTLARRSPF